MNRMLLTLTMAALGAAETLAAPLGSGFTYQGRLNDGGQPATGKYDMVFNLYDAPTNGNILGTFSIFGGVPVTNGLFTVELNAYGEFSTNAFNGQARWLQIGVRTNSNNAMNPWINLNPRQSIQCTPNAMFAGTAGNAAKADMANTVADGAITASKLAPGSVQPNNLAPGALTWSNITGIPTGFADGVDDIIFYKAGKGLNLDWLFEFSVNFAGSGSANSVARSDHGHFGTTWGGSASLANGLSVTNGANNSVGLYGQQGTGSGFPYLFGNTAGVWGESSHGNGVWGASGSTTGGGVVGVGVHTNGSNAGVTGHSLSTSGTGVRGLASAQTGETSGVRGESVSTQGSGVFGKATSATGINFGVRGETASSSGQAIHGLSTATFGTTAGVAGQANSTDGVGIRGLATGATGNTTGVRGEAYSPQGFGVVARNDNGVALKASGTGIIQSEADSYIWIPASAAVFNLSSDYRYPNTYFYDGVMQILHNFQDDDDSVWLPLTLPGILFGQSTTIKSIEIFYSCENGTNSYIKGTIIRSSNNPSGNAASIYSDNIVRKSQTNTSYVLPINYKISSSSPFLTLELVCHLSNHDRVYFAGAKVRLGHK